MILVKSCFSKDHVKNRKKIRLGSLDYYKNTKHEQIVDRGEGEVTFEIDFESKVEIDRNVFNTLFHGFMHVGGDDGELLPFHGGFEVRADRIHVHSYTSRIVKLNQAKASIKQFHHNSLIFCMSRLASVKEAAEIFPEYDDYWWIEEVDIDVFARNVGKLLYQYLLKEHAKGVSVLEKDLDPSMVKIYCQVGEISYLPRKIKINNENAPQLDEILNRMSSKAFTKPPEPYSREKEYRFVYFVVHDGNIIAPKIESAILDVSGMLELFHW